MTDHDTSQGSTLAGRAGAGWLVGRGRGPVGDHPHDGCVAPGSQATAPRRRVVTGTLERRGSAVPTGSAWVDEPGRDEVVVRLSRAIGLPEAVPDIHGLAMRVPTPAGVGDLLFASTGWSLLGRFVLTFGGGPESRPMTTLLPYRTAEGPVLLGVRAIGAAGLRDVVVPAAREVARLRRAPAVRRRGAGPGDLVRPGAQPAARPHAVRLGTAAPGAVVQDRQEVAPAVTARGQPPEPSARRSSARDSSSGSRRLLRWCCTISVN